MCRVLEISRSGYYDWQSKGMPQKQDRDAVLLASIRQVERENGGNYGVRRVHKQLSFDGVKCSRSRVQRVMHVNGVKAQIRSKYKPQTTKADPAEKAFPNLLEQDFSVKEKNKVWLSDITYIRVNGKWAYLAAVIDLGRRKLVGWALGVSPDAELAAAALKQAIAREQPESGLIHHSDRGSQYTSKLYRELLGNNEFAGSMSRTGNPYDNAPMESFFQTLKTEFVYKQAFGTIEQAARLLGEWFDYYNTVRLHSALGYKSPLSYEISSFHSLILSA